MGLLDTILKKKAGESRKEQPDELYIKRKELFEAAEAISERKLFLKDIYDRLQELYSMPAGPEKDKRMDAVLTTLGGRMSFYREIRDFYSRSEVLFNDYLVQLSDRFPELTESERKLALLLHQGFSGKQIAALMDITPKSVEISRYRLRTRLGLKREDNLLQFLKSI